MCYGFAVEFKRNEIMAHTILLERILRVNFNVNLP
jgi:hypothetical protein